MGTTGNFEQWQIVRIYSSELKQQQKLRQQKTNDVTKKLDGGMREECSFQMLINPFLKAPPTAQYLSIRTWLR